MFQTQESSVTSTQNEILRRDLQQKVKTIEADLQKRTEKLGKQALGLKDEIEAERKRIKTLKNDLIVIEEELKDPKAPNNKELLERKTKTNLLIALIEANLQELQRQQRNLQPLITELKHDKLEFEKNKGLALNPLFETQQQLNEEISQLETEIDNITKELSKFPEDLAYDDQSYFDVGIKRGNLIENRGKKSRLLDEKKKLLEQILLKIQPAPEMKTGLARVLEAREKEAKIDPQKYQNMNFLEIFQLPLPTIEKLIKIVAKNLSEGEKSPGYQRTSGELVVDSRIKQRFVGHNTASITTSKDWRATYSPLFLKKLNAAKYMKEITQNLDETQQMVILEKLEETSDNLKKQLNELSKKQANDISIEGLSKIDKTLILIIEKELDRRKTEEYDSDWIPANQKS